MNILFYLFDIPTTHIVSPIQTAMNALITTLLACSPHYVRCIKPNDNKKAGTIDEQRIRHQVRYLGYFTYPATLPISSSLPLSLSLLLLCLITSPHSSSS